MNLHIISKKMIEFFWPIIAIATITLSASAEIPTTIIGNSTISTASVSRTSLENKKQEIQKILNFVFNEKKAAKELFDKWSPPLGKTIAKIGLYFMLFLCAMPPAILFSLWANSHIKKMGAQLQAKRFARLQNIGVSILFSLACIVCAAIFFGLSLLIEHIIPEKELNKDKPSKFKKPLEAAAKQLLNGQMNVPEEIQKFVKTLSQNVNEKEASRALKQLITIIKMEQAKTENILNALFNDSQTQGT